MISSMITLITYQSPNKMKFTQKITDLDYKLILGKYEDERICHLIDDIVNQCQTGSFQNDQVIEACNGEESKVGDTTCENCSTPNGYNKDKEIAAMFYIRIMTSEKETVMLLNECHSNLSNAVQNYNNADEVIQNDNLTRRIPEHLDDEEK